MEKKQESFKTEVNEILHMIIHSLYSHPEIFLRELISNASDALDKLKLEALTNSSLLPSGYEPFIRITPNKDERTLTIQDTGIGMTLEEVRDNIGTIARSGTKEFVRMQKELKNNPELIGQFGVGFYSAFMVADKIVLQTRRAGSDTGVRWESEAKGTYSLEEIQKDEIGTVITLHLKECGEGDGALPDFTQEWVLRNIVKKHSDFISYPIKMETSREEGEGDDKTVVVEDQILNSQKALWLRPSSEISEDEYNELYRQVSHDYQEPIKCIHFKAEGTLEFSSLLYIPASKPFDYDYEGASRGLRLYVRRVQIMEDCEELLPRYLRFVRGLVDSSDLPLNVSREMLQHDRQISQISKAVVKRVLRGLDELLGADREKYGKFWGNFGATLKEGIVRDPAKKDDILPLCLFHGTHGSDLRTLQEYIDTMPETQPAIYYMTGDSLESLRNSPLLERLREKGYQVLLLVDQVDAFITAHLDEFKGKKFQSVSAADLDIDTEEEKKEKESARQAASERLQPILDVVKETLASDVKEVTWSDRLSSSPACLVSDHDTHAMEQMEALYRQMGKEPPKNLRTLELNPTHPVIEKMINLPKEKQTMWSQLLYDQSLIAEGGKISDPSAFARRLTALMLENA